MIEDTELGMDIRHEVAMPFYKVWWIAITSPKESTYLELLQTPESNFRKALLWLSLVYAIEAPIGLFWDFRFLSRC
jgi:hypothetical protein